MQSCICLECDLESAVAVHEPQRAAWSSRAFGSPVLVSSFWCHDLSGTGCPLSGSFLYITLETSGRCSVSVSGQQKADSSSASDIPQHQISPEASPTPFMDFAGTDNCARLGELLLKPILAFMSFRSTKEASCICLARWEQETSVLFSCFGQAC